LQILHSRCAGRLTKATAIAARTASVVRAGSALGRPRAHARCHARAETGRTGSPGAAERRLTEGATGRATAVGLGKNCRGHAEDDESGQ